MDISNTQITRRQEKAFNDLKEEFRNLYSEDDFLAAINDLIAAGDTSARSSKLRQLYKLFDACGIAYEKGMDNSYYEELVESAEAPSFEEIENRVMRSIFRMYQSYTSPEAFMKRIVDRLSNEEDGWNEDTLRLRILKQFIKYGNCLSKAGIRGKKYIKEYAEDKGCKSSSKEEWIKYLDDNIFCILDKSLDELKELINSKQKNIKKKDIIKRFEIIKAADDLASGKFRTNGATKQYLYLFAMVYDMTYYTGTGGSLSFDEERDIDKNLFKDYYTNNFIRFVSDAYRGKMKEYEQDPSGQGINYKNYAEVVYLYYISRSDMKAEDKICESQQMIDRIKQRMLGKGEPSDYSKTHDTEKRRALILGKETEELFVEDILSRPADEFEEFLCANYFCDTSGSHEALGEEAKSIMSPLQLETSQETAYKEYLKIRDLLYDEVELSDDLEIPGKPTVKENCCYGLWLDSMSSIKNSCSFDTAENSAEDEQEQYDRFTQFLYEIHKYLVPTEGSINALEIASPDKVTRAAMITVYYYYYNALNENFDDMAFMGFEAIYNEFREGIDEYLQRANYQLFSEKNIFDIIIAFSSYAYISQKLR